MKCEPCTSLLDMEEDSLQTSSLDTHQQLQLSGMDMPAKSYENGQPMGGSPGCECGRGMSDCLIHPSTPAEWTRLMSSTLDFLVKTFQLRGISGEWDTIQDQVCTGRYSGLLASFDPDSCSLKTSQQSFLTDSQPYSQTLPRWGLMLDGCVYGHPMSERRITETDGFYWPTPTMSDYKGGSKNGRDSELKHYLVANFGGTYPHPTFVEELMGFPIGFTVSKDWATPKSRSKQQLPTDSLEVSE